MTETNAWNEWTLVAGHPWQHFVTLTFPWDTSKARADKSWRVYISKVARLTMSANQARRKGLPWVRSLEEHVSGSTHIHALVSGCQAKDLIRLWEELVSSYAIIDVRPYNPTLGGFAYLVKDGDVDVSRYFTAA